MSEGDELRVDPYARQLQYNTHHNNSTINNMYSITMQSSSTLHHAAGFKDVLRGIFGGLDFFELAFSIYITDLETNSTILIYKELNARKVSEAKSLGNSNRLSKFG